MRVKDIQKRNKKNTGGVTFRHNQIISTEGSLSRHVKKMLHHFAMKNHLTST